jgi:hypothetical protein
MIRLLTNLMLFPVRHPLFAVGWFVGGMLVLADLMAAGMQGPTSAANQRIEFVMYWIGPIGGICLLLIALGIVAGPWCLLARFLGAVDRDRDSK